MIKATKKWIFLKVSGATSVPLMIWFIINFTSIYDQIEQNFLYRDAIATFDEKLGRYNCDREEHFKLIKFLKFHKQVWT